jgi:hypothetical protein
LLLLYLDQWRVRKDVYMLLKEILIAVSVVGVKKKNL